MTNTPSLLTSRTIGETENALRALLLGTLNGTGLDYHRWVALKLVSEAQPPLSDSVAVEELRAGLKIDHAIAVEVIADLRSAGMVTQVGDSLTPTPEGAAVYRRLSDEIRLPVQLIWNGLEPDDLATAQRVLSTIRDAANVLLGELKDAAGDRARSQKKGGRSSE